MEHVKFVLLLLPIVAVVVLGLLLHRIVNLRRLAPLAAVLDGRFAEGHGVLSVSLEGRFNGSQAAFRIVPQGKHRPAQFRIELACSSSKDFRIRPEDAGSRMKKKLRILREVEVQDPTLDDRFVLSSSDPEFLKRWLGNSDVRRNVLTVMALGVVDSLQLRDGRLATSKTPFRSEDRDPTAVRDVLERLQVLVPTIPG